MDPPKLPDPLPENGQPYQLRQAGRGMVAVHYSKGLVYSMVSILIEN